MRMLGKWNPSRLGSRVRYVLPKFQQRARVIATRAFLPLGGENARLRIRFIVAMRDGVEVMNPLTAAGQVATQQQ